MKHTFWRAWYLLLDLLCRIGIHRWEPALFMLRCGCPEIPGEACERCDATRTEWTHNHTNRSQGDES